MFLCQNDIIFPCTPVHLISFVFVFKPKKKLTPTPSTRLHGALAAVEEVLQGDELLLVLDEVHARLVVLEEDVRVALEHRVELLLEDGRLQRQNADEVVEIANVHVEELVLGGAVQDVEVLVHQEVLVELDVGELDVVHVAVEAGVQGHEGVHEVRGALLVEEGDEAGTADHGDGHDLLSTDGVGGELAVLGEDLLEVTGDLLHGHVLGVGADTRHGETDVDGGALATREQLRVEVDLTVRNRNDVRDDVGRDIVGERLDDGEGRQGTATLAGRKHGGALEQTRVQVEDVTGVGLTTGGTAEQQGELAVGDGLLRQIVVDDEAVATAVHEVLTHGDTGVGGQELETGGLGGGGGHDGGVAEGTVRGEEAVDTGDVGATLADGHVDGNDGVLAQDLLVDADLVDDGRDGEGRLTRLTVTDNKLTLTTADGDERVDALEAREQVVVDGGAGHNVGGAGVDLAHLHLALGEERVGACEEARGDLVAERVHDLTEDVETAGDVEELAGGHHLLAGLNLVDVVHENDTDAAVLLQVEDEARGDHVGADLDLDDGVVGDAGGAGGGDDGGDGAVDGVDVADELVDLGEGLLGGGGLGGGGLSVGTRGPGGGSTARGEGREAAHVGSLAFV
eukprot:PhM_4_TR5339/c1_g1_i2/m.77773